ncbi:SNF2 family N-terminal domain-domain-containing protein [Leucosporidium creatinivorum]|uniref:SNF2 family N-terminal domain-domain-containing protein n=1 Tax=Leucosporidium creatinivorum TaxID=106004 RepID=A0A1Y2F1L2_9BASI|nr:SNF2 family N-terminal domain-domain-containing protein [Leucosporidium creatinivorum]
MPPTASTSSNALARRPSFSAQQHSSPHFNGGGSKSKGKGREVDHGSGGEEGAPMVEQTPLVWEVSWRNVQNKKNKTWESDGFLVLKGAHAVLRDENGKSLGSSTLSGPIFPDDEVKVGGKEVLVQDPLPYSTFLTRFNYVPSTQTQAGASPLPSAAPRRAPSLPPSTLAQQLSRAAVPSGGVKSVSQGFKPLKLMGSALQQPRRLSSGSGGGTPKLERRESENRAPKSTVERKESKGKGKEVDMEIDGSSPVVAPGKKRSRVVQSDGEEEQEEAPRKVSPVVGRKDRVEQVEMMELDDDDEEDDDVQVMGPPKVAGKPVGSKFKGLSSLKGVVKTEEGEEMHCYLCMWRKYSTKKNPSWEGDGVLVITGKKATLKDRDTGKDLGSSTCSGARLSSGDPVQVGSKTCEIDSLLSTASYLDGSIFLKGGRNQFIPPPPPATLSTTIASTSFFAPPALVKPRPPNPFNDPVTGGKLGVGKTPLPRFDPKEEGAVVMKRMSKEGEDIWNKKKLPVVDVVIDPLMGKLLRPHQKEGVKFMYECVMGMRSEGQGCILADEMGLGKTIQGIALIWTLMKQNPFWGAGTGVIERAMIVCPVTLVKNWLTEIRKWLGRDRLRVFVADQGANVKSFCAGKSYQILIIGYEKLRTIVDDLKSIQPPIGLIICDEGHRLKSSGAKVTKALRSLNCKRRIIMTGTPIQNDLQEYHTMVDFVNPGCLDTYSTFKKIFENPILKSREPNASAKVKEVGTARNDQLQRIGQAFMLRRTGEVISKYLPPKLEYTVFIMPTQIQLAIYAKIIEGNAVRDVLNGAGGGNAQQLSVLNVLKKLCNTPGLLMQQLKEGKGLDILRGSVVKLLEEAGSDPFDLALSGKMLALGSLLQELRKANDEKIVVVSNFTSTLDIIEKHCKSNKYPFCRLDGKTDQKERISIVNSFNRGPVKSNFVFLLSSKSGGTGLNIIGASRLVLVDLDWNPSVDLQAMARIHREGQQKQCVIYRFLTSGTMDEKIFQRQTTKLGLSGSLMDNDNVGAASKGDAFTISDLRNIFKHHPGVACQTHELLGCRCHLGEDDQGDAFDPADDEEDEDLPLELGFTQASQYHIEEARPNKERKNLSVLNTWTHHNGCDEQSVDEIEDELLRGIIYSRVAESAEDDVGFEALGKGGMRLRGGQIGMCFAKKSTATSAEGSG